MRRIEDLEMEPDQLCEENTYANMSDLDLWRMRKTPKAKEILAAKNTQHRMILILAVLLILACLILIILMSLQFTYYNNIEEITQLKANYTITEEIFTQLKANNTITEEIFTQLKANNKNIEEEITQLKANYKNIEEEITQLKANYSALKKDVSDLQELVANIKNDPNKMKLNKNKGSSNPLCSEGWNHYGLSCYYFSSDYKPWIASKKDCEDKEAHLVVINSEEEMNFLRGIASMGSLWIGLTDADGTWRWVDGTSYDITPKFWGNSQPDDWKGHHLGAGEDCATLRHAYDWNDDHCSEKLKYICEKKMTF